MTNFDTAVEAYTDAITDVERIKAAIRIGYDAGEIASESLAEAQERCNAEDFINYSYRLAIGLAEALTPKLVEAGDAQ